MAVLNAQDFQSTPPRLEVELLEAARAIKDDLREQAAATEVNGRVSAEMTKRLKAAGLLSIMKPRRFGGHQLPPSTVARIAYELGQGCGSTAWCSVVANTTSWYATYWPLPVQESIWGTRPDSLVAGAVAPTGRCERVAGGYRLSGNWPFASNCDNSDWMIISAMVPSGTDEAPGAGWFMVPIAELEIDDASWQVCGLNGTGSKTCVAREPIFVAEDRMIRFSDVIAGTTPGHAIEGNVPARFGFTTFGASCLAGSLLGMAQGGLQWFVEAMKTKARVPLRPGAPATAAHNIFTQSRIGEASAAIDAAMALLLQQLEPAEEKILNGEPLSVTERVTLRRNAGYAARQAVFAVNLLFEGAGASSSDISLPLQRFWRDANAGARHATLDAQAIYGLVGQERFGLPLVGQY